MSYTIRYFRDGEHFDEEWQGSLSDAKDTVVGHVAVGGVDRTEVRDAAGLLVFHYPRTVRRP